MKTSEITPYTESNLIPIYYKGEVVDYAQVSNCDVLLLSKYRWNLVRRKYTSYAVAYINGKNVFMHRFILNVNDRDIYVDHKDGDGLNNKRNNIRVCTPKTNAMNRRTQIGTSRYKGVHLDPKSKAKWRAQVQYNNQVIYLGLYPTERLAGIAYNIKAKELFGEFAKLNNIQPTKKELEFVNTTIGNLAKYTSKHKGVSFHKARKKWRAYVTIQGKSTHIGMYNTEEEAVKAREEFINKLGGLE
jgi:hypothetical protein